MCPCISIPLIGLREPRMTIWMEFINKLGGGKVINTFLNEFFNGWYVETSTHLEKFQKKFWAPIFLLLL
jgi:hypothetical protein